MTSKSKLWSFIFILILGAMILFPAMVHGALQDIYSIGGTFTWTCPQGVTSVDVEVRGGGGAGGFSGSSQGSGGGGGGAYSKKTGILVTPGQSYTVVVGKGADQSVLFGGSTLGNYDGGGSGDTNLLRACKYSLSEAAVITAIKAYFTNVSGSYNCYATASIYSDNNGYPGSKLGESGVYNIQQGGYTLFQMPVTALAAGTYWLVTNCYVNTSTIGRMFYGSGSSNQEYSKTGSYGGTIPSGPSTFPSGATGTANALNIYAVRMSGGDSYFINVSTVLAKGGTGGGGPGGLGASGGDKNRGVGDVKYSGGNGAAFYSTTQGGGGGGGAGDAADGGNASGQLGGSGGTSGGGKGGNGGIISSQGVAGSSPGGGGGGASAYGSGLAGGNGGDGKVVLSATVSVGAGRSYVYDELNRLIQVIYEDGRSVTYTYDALGNRLGTETQVIDISPPTTTASPPGGIYALGQTITLSCNDGSGSGCDKIYYTTDGTTPTTSSPVYSSPINISVTTALKFFAKDLAGNSETVQTQIYIIGADTTPPTTTASPAGGTYDSAQSVTLSCTDGLGLGCDKTYYTTDGTTPTTSSPVYSSPINISVTTTLKFFSTDLASNSETVKAQVYTIDTTPPMGTITINSGAAFTNSPNVTLTLTCEDASGCSQMKFSNDVDNESHYSTPEAYSATKAWALSSGEGTKTVYAKFKDAGGNWSTAYSDTITVSYTISLLHMNGTDQSTTFTDNAAGGSHTWTARGSAQIDTAQSKFGGASGLFDGNGDAITTPDATDLQMGSGDFTIDFWVRYSSGGNYYTIFDKGYTASGALVLQTDTSSSPKMRVYINGAQVRVESTGATTGAWHHYAIVRYGSGSNNVTIYRDGVATGQGTSTANINNTSGVAIGAKGGTYEYSLNGWLDEFRISKGIARWTSDFTPPSDEYIIDTTPPTTTASPTGGTYNSAQSVTLTCNDGSGSGCDKIYYTTDGTTPTTSSPVYSSSINISVTTTLKFIARDLAGNVEPVKTQTYTIDTTPPTGTITINSGAAYTTSTNVTLTLSCNDAQGCAQMQFSNDNITYSTPEAYATTKAWPLTSGDGTKTVYVKFKDTPGNWSAAYSNTILLDATAPTTTASPIGGTYNSAQSVTLTCSDGTGSGCDKIYYTTDGTTPIASSPVYSSPINISVTATLKFFGKDLAGNSEAVRTETYTISTNMVTVQLKDSTGNPLSGGVVQYYSGGWQTFGTTDASGQVSKELRPASYTFSMTYGFARQEKSQNVATNPTVVFQTTKVTIQLKDSTGGLMDTGTVQYYSGGWRDIGTTSGGQVTKELLPLTYTFSMTYGFARQEKSQNVATNPTVVFQTTKVTVELRDSTNSLMDPGTVQYYSGGWRDIGSTSGGQVTKELLPLIYTFSMTYGFARQEKSQNIATNPTVLFQTTRVMVELRDSVNSLMDTGTVQYYSGGWRDIGSTSGGQVTKELLPASYTFSMNYAFARQEKAQNIATNPTVVFQTTKVTIELRDSTGALMDTGTVQYYSEGWRDIGATSGGQVTKELLPGSYTFSMNYAYARQEKAQNIASNPTVVFQTINATVQLKDSTGVLMDTGTVQYYSGGWRDIGTTSGGQVTKELLPLTYTFSMTYSFARQEKAQNIATNPTVVFQTINATVQLKDSTGALIDTGTVQYYSGGWRDIGATSGGQVTKELLPLSYTFSMTYGFARQEKSQNVATNPTVVFQTGQVHSDSSSCTHYYAGGWRVFIQDMELLPVTYTFRFNDGTPEGSYTIIAGSVNHIH